MAVVEWPTDLADVTEVDLWLEDPSVINVSPFDQSSEVASLPPFWHGLASWGVLKGNRSLRLDAWLHQLLPGSGNVAMFPLLKYRQPIGTMAGTITLFGAHSQGDTSLAIAGNTGGPFEPGDFIRLVAARPHVYQVVSGGVAAITIQPPLKRDYADLHEVAYLGSGVGSSQVFPLYTQMYLVPPLTPNPMIPGKYSRGRSVEFIQAIRPDTIFVD